MRCHFAISFPLESQPIRIRWASYARFLALLLPIDDRFSLHFVGILRAIYAKYAAFMQFFMPDILLF